MGEVTDAASERLADLRARRQANKEELRRVSDMWARTMYDKGACETRTVSLVRGRFCLALKVRARGWRGAGGAVGRSVAGNRVAAMCHSHTDLQYTAGPGLGCQVSLTNSCQLDTELRR